MSDQHDDDADPGPYAACVTLTCDRAGVAVPTWGAPPEPCPACQGPVLVCPPPGAEVVG